MMLRKILGGITLMAIGCNGGIALAQSELTTVSEEMQVAVALQFSSPECYYEFDGKTLSWREPTEGESHYIRVTVRDLASSHLVTGASPKAVLTLPSGKTMGTSITLHETWDRETPHYGANLQIPDDVTSGNVALRIDPPKGRRLGREFGGFFTKPLTLSFSDVDFSGVEPVKDEDDLTTEPGKVDWPEGRRPYVEPTPYPGAQR